jgi:hypothetical protein
VATLDAKTNVVCCCIHSLRHEEQGHIASAKREYLNAPAKITTPAAAALEAQGAGKAVQRTKCAMLAGLVMCCYHSFLLAAFGNILANSFLPPKP